MLPIISGAGVTKLQQTKEILMSYLFIFLTIILTVYAQIVIKWQVTNAGDLPVDILDKLWFLIGLLLNPWVVSAFFGAFLGSLTWMAALTKLELSHAYPFIGLTFVLVLFISGFLFQEPITLSKLIGVGLVVLGIVVGSQG